MCSVTKERAGHQGYGEGEIEMQYLNPSRISSKFLTVTETPRSQYAEKVVKTNVQGIYGEIKLK